jgi:type IV secretion system protein VirB8
MSIFSKLLFWRKDVEGGLEQETKNQTDISYNSKQAEISDAGGWYHDRYEALVVQRNLLFVLAVIAFITVIVCIFSVKQVTLSKNIEAMIVEVEDKTGITNIVNPATDKNWSSDKAISEYFLMTYLRARETYNVAQYSYNYNTVVRLLSTAQVYAQFKDTVTNPSTNPVTRYGASNSTSLKVRSIQHLENSPTGDQNVQIRFAVIENGNDSTQINKIVSILWNYTTMQMKFDDRMVNPLGFQVKFYSVADDVS